MAKPAWKLWHEVVKLRELSKDVVLRLAGKNEKAVRQLAFPTSLS